MTHDYKRNGTTTLFAALEVLQGKVIGQCHQRHRHQEFLKFLRTLEQEFPGEIPLHLVMDNYGTHKHENVRNWLKRHPRFVLHFVPTSSSWLNLVERWFGPLGSKGDSAGRIPKRGRSECLHRRVPHGVEQGSEAIRLDRDGRIHHGETLPLPANAGEDPARLYQSPESETQEITVHLFRGHYTR